VQCAVIAVRRCRAASMYLSHFWRHLVDHGYIEAAEKLQSESRISLQVLSGFVVCVEECVWLFVAVMSCAGSRIMLIRCLGFSLLIYDDETYSLQCP
jgi:hypothetical protein